MKTSAILVANELGATMRYFSPAQLVVLILLAVLAVIPTVIILRRLGYSGWWAVLAAISPVNIIGLWILAFAKWPLERGAVTRP